jgi:hypothetical protein
MDISFAGKLWQIFRAVISGALDGLKAVLGGAITLVMEAIDAHLQCLFVQVLQFSPEPYIYRLCKSMGYVYYGCKNELRNISFQE